LSEAAIRFAITSSDVGTILVGMASVEQFETSLAAGRKGPLPPEVLQRIAQITSGFAGESR
jgi:aryl-alcohol dehydrogenase-like predicted oxidoreductase